MMFRTYLPELTYRCSAATYRDGMVIWPGGQAKVGPPPSRPTGPVGSLIAARRPLFASDDSRQEA